MKVNVEYEVLLIH